MGKAKLHTVLPSILIIIAITQLDSHYSNWQGAEKYVSMCRAKRSTQRFNGQNKQVKINIVSKSVFDYFKSYMFVNNICTYYIVDTARLGNLLNLKKKNFEEFNIQKNLCIFVLYG